MDGSQKRLHGGEAGHGLSGGPDAGKFELVGGTLKFKQDQEFLVGHRQVEVFDTNEAASALADFTEFNFCHCRPRKLCLDRSGRLDHGLFSRQ